MTMPAVAAARMPDAAIRSATTYEPNGSSRLMRICVPVSSPKRRAVQSLAAFASNVTAAPAPTPPTTSQRNVPPASTSENDPVTAAAIAKRRQTRPDASLSSASPSSTCIRRFGTGTRSAIADTATASVGESVAASAKATGSGIAGMSQWMKRPAPTTVNTTRPSANAPIVHLSRRSPSFEMCQPSRKSSGATNNSRNTSGASETRKFSTWATSAPNAICTTASGSETRVARLMKLLAMTQASKTSVWVIVSKGGSGPRFLCAEASGS